MKDPKTREELICSNLPLVRHVVHRFFPSATEKEDLYQIGCIGLIKAVDRFDPSYGVEFSTYAVPMIIGEIRIYLRDNNPVKIGRGRKDLLRRARQVERELAQALERTPTLGEVAGALGVDRADLAALMEAGEAPLSLQGPVCQDSEGVALEESLPALDWSLDEGAEVRAALKRLSPQARAVLEMRFFGDLTQADIGRRLGLTQVQVCRIEKRALIQLRTLLAP